MKYAQTNSAASAKHAAMKKMIANAARYVTHIQAYAATAANAVNASTAKFVAVKTADFYAASVKNAQK